MVPLAISVVLSPVVRFDRTEIAVRFREPASDQFRAEVCVLVVEPEDERPLFVLATPILSGEDRLEVVSSGVDLRPRRDRECVVAEGRSTAEFDALVVRVVEGRCLVDNSLIVRDFAVF